MPIFQNRNFELATPFKPTGDQPEAIDALVRGITKEKKASQVLLGVTGSGKTFTMANVIAKLNKLSETVVPIAPVLDVLEPVAVLGADRLPRWGWDPVKPLRAAALAGWVLCAPRTIDEFRQITGDVESRIAAAQ